MNKKILKNNKGVTILYSLLGLLIFMLVSTVIFNAANSNYVRFRKETQQQQSYLAVSSAAETFVDAIAGDKVTFDRDVVDYDFETKYDYYREDTSDITKGANNITYVDNGVQLPISGNTNLSDTFFGMVTNYYFHNNTSNGIRNYTISATINEGESSVTMEDIGVYFKMNYNDATYGLNAYDIIAVFYNKSTENRNYITVLIPFVRDSSNQNPVIDKINDIRYEVINGTTKQVCNITYKVEWDAGNISVNQGNIFGVTVE